MIRVSKATVTLRCGGPDLFCMAVDRGCVIMPSAHFVVQRANS